MDDGAAGTSERWPRSRKDLAERARALTWYWVVRRLSQATSDEQLDREFAHPSYPPERRPQIELSRPRVFWGVRRHGQSPDLVAKRGFSLVDAVAAHSRRMEASSRVYRSPFWTLLSPPAPSAAHYTEIVEALLRAKGLRRLTPAEHGTRYPDGDPDVVAAGLTSLYKVGIDRLCIPDIDMIALLGALHREAANHASYHEAIFIWQRFQDAYKEFAEMYALPDEVRDLVRWLARFRIYENLWANIPSKASRDRSRRYLNQTREELGASPLPESSWLIDAYALRYHLTDQTHLYPIIAQGDDLM